MSSQQPKLINSKTKLNKAKKGANDVTHNEILFAKNIKENTLDKNYTIGKTQSSPPKNNKVKNKNSSKSESTTNTQQVNKNVIICGDSLLNGIESAGISDVQNKVIVRAFPGASSLDMVDYVKPLVNKKPDIIIVHVGTNDLQENVQKMDN